MVNRGIQGYTKGIQGYTGVYRGIQRHTWYTKVYMVYKGIHRYTREY